MTSNSKPDHKKEPKVIRPKLYTITVDAALPKPLTFMAYAPTKQGAISKFAEHIVSAELATPLEIADHIRANRPILGEPEKPDSKQTELPV